ncbi:MAG: hypothetical protein DMG79_00790 [Acidobacteria bacterium]|nr:MAG: hypothetical protein DMG79_00790 [Acidobacteriota bacterium]
MHEIQPYVLWPYVAGSAIALITVFVSREELLRGNGWERILAVGRLALAAPLAAFGAEHLTIAPFIAPMVPSWIPWHLFWAYFVGCSLIAAGLSIATKVQVRLACTLLGIMLLFFVFSIHILRVVANPRDRFAWAVVLRDSAFAGGAWALAGSEIAWRNLGSKLIFVGRLLIGVAAIFFAVEHFLHPTALPGVPLEKLTPTWVPGRIVVDYLTGAFLAAAGIALVLGKNSGRAALYLGTWILLLVLIIYLPMVLVIPPAAEGGVKIEGVNYFFDTLLFAGAVLAFANAMPGSRRTNSAQYQRTISEAKA